MHPIAYDLTMSSKRVILSIVTIAVLGLTVGCSSGDEMNTVESAPTSVAPTRTPFRITRTETPTLTTAAKQECAKPTIEVTNTEFSDRGYQVPLTNGTTWTLRSVTVRVTNNSASKIATTGVRVRVNAPSSAGTAANNMIAIPEDTGRPERSYETINPGQYYDFRSNSTLGAIQSNGGEPTISVGFYDWHFSDRGTDIKCNLMHPDLHK